METTGKILACGDYGKNLGACRLWGESQRVETMGERQEVLQLVDDVWEVVGHL